MEGLIVLGILVFVGYSLYRAGKRTGSRKATTSDRSVDDGADRVSWIPSEWTPQRRGNGAAAVLR